VLKQLTDQAGLVTLISLIIAFKVAFLALYGPIHMPDSAGYAQFADLIWADRSWIFDVDLDRSDSVFRIIGYPAFLALMKAMSPGAWDWLAVGMQGGFSLVATVYVYRLANALNVGLLITLCVTFAHGLGQAFMLDQCILSDSLNASFLIILACHVGIAIIDRRRPSLIETAGLGTLMVAAFLMRESGNYFQVLYWPMIGYWALRVMDTKLKSVAMMVAFILPMVLGVEAYQSWNQMRTGERFITTGASTAMFFPSVYLEQRGVSVFAHDPLLKDMKPLPQIPSTVRALRTTVIPHLMQEHGFTILDVARHGHAMFRDNWQNHPLEMLALTASHIRRDQAQLSVMPIGTLDRTVLWATAQSAFPAPGKLWGNLVNEYRVDQVLMVAGRTIERLVSMVLTLAFVVGAPVLFLREGLRERFAIRRYDPTVVLTALYWLLYCGYTFIYAMIHMEVRYLMPVIPLSTIGAISVLTIVGKMVFPKLLNSEKT